MIKEVVLKTVHYTDWMSEEAKKVVDRFNHYAEKVSGAIEDHLRLIPLVNYENLEDMIDEGAYEYTSTNPEFGKLNEVLTALWEISRPYHNTCWEKDILAVI